MTAAPDLEPGCWALWALAWLLGSVPTGYWMGRALKGVDVRREGSGNTGATNVFRVVGKPAGLATLFLDALKGFLPAWAGLKFFPQDPGVAVAAGVLAITGHNWTPFLGFRGGKGVATSAGVFLALLPAPTLISLGCFAVAFASTRIVSAGSLAGAATLPVSAWFLTRSRMMTALTVFCAALIFILHRKNIARLLRGEELRIRF